MSRTQIDLDRVVQSTLLGEGLANAGVAALLADDRGEYVAVNDRACTLTGYERAALVGLKAGDLSADEESARIYDRLARGKMQGRKQVRCRDGEILACRYWGIPTTVAETTYYLVLLWEDSRPRPKSAPRPREAGARRQKSRPAE